MEGLGSKILDHSLSGLGTERVTHVSLVQKNVARLVNTTVQCFGRNKMQLVNMDLRMTQ